MAKASAKKLAQANNASLNQLHTISAAVFGVVIVLKYLFGSSLKAPIIFSIPMALFEYFLEKTARPKYKGKDLLSPGTDLAQSGLTEYILDVIYFNWICLVLSLITNKAWYLYFIIPVFASYKAFQLLKMGKQLLGGGGAKAPASADESSSDAASTPAQAPQTRRQRRARV